jgi:ATP-dependent helicase/nuclease subunit A
MNDTRWTDEQLDAITAKDCSLLVAAAAGAGKTAVLVERIIQKITDSKNPLDIDRLLIVTFTNAAATEMRERIGEAISRVLEKDSGSRLMQRQLALLGKASITTIHSFCMEVIRSNFQRIDIDPDFRVADEAESSLMKLEALNDLFEEQYEKENNEPFFDLLECYGGNRDDQALMDMVLNVYDFIQSSPWPEAWLTEMTENLNIPDGMDFGWTAWGKILITSVKLELEGIRELMASAVEMVKTGLGLEKYLAVFNEDLINIESIIRLTDEDLSARTEEPCAPEDNSEAVWDRLFIALKSVEFSTLPRAAKEADKEKQETVKNIRDNTKAVIKRLRDKIVTADSKNIAEDLKILYPKIKCLSELVKGLTVKYAEKKDRRSVLDFNDLEHFCLEILSEKAVNGEIRPSAAALSYRERFAEILVDEYQDSNLVQEIIISMISKNGDEKPNVFMVGDVKQSIYRFRQARPELFLHKYAAYSPNKGEPYRKILLYKNFRSRKNVVDTVNFLFKQIMSVNAGELDYTDTEALNPGAVFEENTCVNLTTGGETELHLIGTGDSGSDPESVCNEDGTEDPEAGTEGEILDKIQCEARLVARRIHELIGPDENGRTFAVYDKTRKEYRKVEFRDIVVLLRTTKNWSEVFADELALMGIPAFADTGSGFFKTVEVQVMISLLQIIDNPLQDIPLLSVLRSPVFSFTTEEITELRLSDRKDHIFIALRSFASKDRGKASEKAADFLIKLEKWREMSLYMSTDQLIWQLYNDTGYYGMVGALPFGEQRQANLRILFERARDFEETSYKGLFNFISFIDKLKSSKGDMGSAKILSESDNVVRIMSIHKSKGLEFPVVFLSGCGKKFNLQDMNKSILLHQDLGFGPDAVDTRLRVSWPSAAKQAIKEKIRSETLSEEMRILYVALTRAREKLIITGAVNDTGKAVSKWLSAAGYREEKLPGHEMLKANNYLDWIGPALLRHNGCGSLRESVPPGSEYRGCLIDDESEWRVKLWSKNDVLMGRISGDGGEDDFLEWLEALDSKENDSLVEAEIIRRLAWEYPYAEASKIPVKVSVTELKRRFNSQGSEDPGTGYLPPLIKKPGFLEEKKGLSASEKGTTLHFIMQHLNLKLIGSQKPQYMNAGISRQVEEMASRDLLTRKQIQSIDIDKIESFFASDLGRRLLSSARICREVPFNMAMSCKELYSAFSKDSLNDETILLQGVIDCYFEEPDGIVLIDYKTDYVQEGHEQTLKERYRPQMDYYSRALESLAMKKVKEKYIYLFWNGEMLELN